MFVCGADASPVFLAELDTNKAGTHQERLLTRVAFSTGDLESLSRVRSQEVRKGCAMLRMLGADLRLWVLKKSITVFTQR